MERSRAGMSQMTKKANGEGGDAVVRLTMRRVAIAARRTED
jgi:hypothetical protein